MGFNIQTKDIIDIVLVAILMYKCYMWTKGTGAKNIFLGLIIFTIAWFLVTRIFKMELLGAIFDGIFNVGAIAIIVIFQVEIRQFFSKIGSRKSWKKVSNFLEKIHLKRKAPRFDISTANIAEACVNLSKERMGALIVMVKDDKLQEIVDTGEAIDAAVNSQLIENIFFKNSPLHDGALIVENNRMVAAGAILPISRSHEIPKYLGLRHRAAIGITERSDAVVIVVSEETGNISLVKDGKISINVNKSSLENIIKENIQE